MHLILLVGSNPLPNYIAAKMLSPDHVSLLYSSETIDIKDRLRECLGSVITADCIHDEIIDDATLVASVQQAFEAALRHTLDGEAVHLNYTGGTKVMATHAHAVWANRKSAGWEATYLDDREGLLRNDDGTHKEIDVTFDLDDVLALHGVERKAKREVRDGENLLPTREDARKVMQYVIESMFGNAGVLYATFCELKDNKGNDKYHKNPQRKLALEIGFDPDDWTTDDVREAWAKFLCGTWLEEWTADLIAKLLPGATIDTNLECLRNGRRFEIDVAVVLGHCLHMISCTTHSGKERGDVSRNKNKLFEATIRAQQMGGDLARPALVTLLQSSELVQSDMNALWESHTKPCVFGLKHLQAWYDGNANDLRNWLEHRGSVQCLC